MKSQNITLKVDADLLRKAKIIAAERGTSLSALLAGKLADAVGGQDCRAAPFVDRQQRAHNVLVVAGIRSQRQREQQAARGQLGGAIAQTIALERPDRVSTLIFMPSGAPRR